MRTISFPRFRVPALVQGMLTYFSSESIKRRWIIVTFVHEFDPVAVAVLSRQAWLLNENAGISLMLAVSAEPCALHRLGHNAPLIPNLIFLADPLRRLNRTFELPNQQGRERCHTFVFDPNGRLQFHAVHGLLDLEHSTLSEILRAGQVQAAPAELHS